MFINNNELLNKQSSLWSLTMYFLKLGTIGFGGPIALTSAMHEDLVEKRGWFTEKAFEEGMALSQLAPGPLAAQLCIYFGWAHSRVLGATVVGLAFVIPSFLMVLVLSVIYVRYEGLSWLAKAFYGIGASVIAVIALGAWKLCKKTLKMDKLLWSVAILNAVLTAYTGSEIIWVFLISGLFIMFVKTRYRPRAGIASILPVWMFIGAAEPATLKTLNSIFFFFLKAGTFVFGSGLAIIPFLHEVVSEHHWLTERQFLDAVAVAMITPGPVVITVAFIGFIVAGFAGAVLSAAGVFLPCYFFTVIPAPYFSRISKNKFIKEFVTGVTTAAVGAIFGAVFVIAKNSITDMTTIAVCVVSLVAISKFKVSEPLLIVSVGAISILLF